MENKLKTTMESYSNSDDLDSREEDQGPIEYYEADTFKLLKEAEEIVDRLNLYVNYNGLDMLTSSNCLRDMMILISR